MGGECKGLGEKSRFTITQGWAAWEASSKLFANDKSAGGRSE